MNTPLKLSETSVSGRQVARNSLLNFVGQSLPILAALIATPYTLYHLGAERFGILAIAWIVVSYFSMFDLGLGRATTKFVAEALGRGELERITNIIGTSFLFVTSASVLAGVALYLCTPTIVNHVMHVQGDLSREAQAVCHILSASILVTMLSSSANGVLEAYQRFDLINVLRVPSNALTHVLPVAVLAGGGTLALVVLALVLKNLAVLVVQLLFCLRLAPLSQARWSIDTLLVRSLLSFGAWIVTCNAAVSLLLYVDRILVGALLSVAAVAYYSVPSELVSRTAILPSSIMMVLFPVFSSLDNREHLRVLVRQAFQYLLLLMAPMMGFVIAFSREILLTWLGPAYISSSAVLRILAVGVLFSSLAWLAGTVLQAAGEPRVVTVIHLWQLPGYLGATWILVKLAGIEGAAVSWSLRLFISLVFLLYACRRRGYFRWSWLFDKNLLKFGLGIGTGTTIAALINSLEPTSWMRAAVVGFAFVLLAFLAARKCAVSFARAAVLCPPAA